MKIKNLITKCLLAILCIMISGFAFGCDGYADKELGSLSGGGCGSCMAAPWNLGYYSPTSKFDIDNVNIDFHISGDFSDEFLKKDDCLKVDYAELTIESCYHHDKLIEETLLKRIDMQAISEWYNAPETDSKLSYYVENVTIPEEFFVCKTGGMLVFWLRGKFEKEDEFLYIGTINLYYQLKNEKLIASDNQFEEW